MASNEFRYKNGYDSEYKPPRTPLCVLGELCGKFFFNPHHWETDSRQHYSRVNLSLGRFSNQNRVAPVCVVGNVGELAKIDD